MIEPQSRPTVVVGPASALQAQMWAADQLRGGDTGYLTCEVLRTEGVVDADRLRECITALMLRHEALTTGFRLDDEGLLQIRADQPAAQLEVRDLTDTRDPGEEFARSVRGSLRRPMRMDRPPLVRWLLGTTESTSYLAVVLHHIVADGWSVDILLGDLAARYAGADLPPAPPPYSAYAQLVAERTADGSLDEAKAYWRAELDSAPVTSAVPGVGLRPTNRGDHQTVMLSAEVLDAVTQLAGKAGVTPFMIHLAALGLLVAARTGSDDVVLGTPSANRSEDAYGATVGPFMNPLPVRIRPTGDLTHLALLHQVRDAVLGAICFQELPFSAIVREHRTADASSLTPVFQIMAPQRVFATGRLAFGGYPTSRLRFWTGTAKYHMTLTFPQEPGDAAVAIEYDLGKYDARFVAALADDYLEVLARMLDDPEGLAGPVYRPAGDGPSRVGRRALQSPGHPAIVEGTTWLSYREVDALSARIGAALRARGIRPGDTVMVQLPRGSDQIVATLGVLAARAEARVADPTWPHERVAELLGGVRAVVTADRGTRDDAEVLRWHIDDLTAAADGDPQRATGPPDPLGDAEPPYPIRPYDRVAYLAVPTSEAGLVEVRCALNAGATLVIAARPPVEPQEYAGLLAECTVAFLPEVLFGRLVSHRPALTALRRLAMLVVEGDEPHPGAVHLLGRIADRRPGSRVTVFDGRAGQPAAGRVAAGARGLVHTEQSEGRVRERLRAIWADTLGCAVADRTDFFRAGGDSMAAVGVLATVDDEFDLAVAPDGPFLDTMFGCFARFADHIQGLLMAPPD